MNANEGSAATGRNQSSVLNVTLLDVNVLRTRHLAHLAPLILTQSRRDPRSSRSLLDFGELVRG